MSEPVKSFSKVGNVVDALGGTAAVARLAGVGTSTVSHWRRSNKFPANSYLLLQTHLREAKLSAPDYLWSLKRARA